jgi:hypothetical protein
MFNFTINSTSRAYIKPFGTDESYFIFRHQKPSLLPLFWRGSTCTRQLEIPYGTPTPSWIGQIVSVSERNYELVLTEKVIRELFDYLPQSDRWFQGQSPAWSHIDVPHHHILSCSQSLYPIYLSSYHTRSWGVELWHERGKCHNSAGSWVTIV